MHRRFAALTIATVITASLPATPLSADTEFEDSIPIELARSLLRGAGNAMYVRIFSDIPDAFPDFELPDSVTLVGSVAQEHSQQVVLRSDGDGMDQQAALIESLQDNGYLLIEQSPTAMQRTGFISPGPTVPNIPVQLCHDSQGFVYIRRQPESDRTFINITVPAYGNRGGYTCAEQAAQRGGTGGSPAFLSSARGSSVTLQSSMPRLVLPEEAATQSPRMPMFLSGSSEQMESKTEFTIDWSLAEVREFFSEQVVEQDWVLDSETTGGRVALGAWTKDENGRMLLGILHLISNSDDNYTAVFTISNLE